ncbi:MAG: ABC transporter permease [Chloroflexota bacterium]
MLLYIIRRIASGIPVLFIVSLFIFSGIRLLPGDPIDALYPPDASVSEEVRDELRRSLGLDRGVHVQYIRWVGGILQGDLGVSIRNQQPVSGLISRRAGKTIQLVVLSTVFAVVLAIPLGTLAALKRGTAIDYAAIGFALFGLSIPGFALGTFFALVFGVWLNWVPTTGHLALPVLTQGLATAGILVRNVRSTIADEQGRDYVRTARGKGISSSTMYLRHVLPNALPVVISVLAVQIGYQLGGTVVIEQVFAYPGIGLLLFDSVGARDYAVIQAIALLMASTYVIVNMIADIVRALLDPRIRLNS